MFTTFFGKKKSERDEAAQQLYDAVVAQAREPVFYEFYGIPDNVDGRFELICLHAFLVMDYLYEQGRAGERIAQAVFDIMFRDMDSSLREMGAGDLGVPRRVRDMMKGFNGRAQAYQDAMQTGDPYVLIEAVRRNLYGPVEEPDENHLTIMALYIHESAAWLQEQDGDEAMKGRIRFKDIDYDETENEAAGTA